MAAPHRRSDEPVGAERFAPVSPRRFVSPHPGTRMSARPLVAAKQLGGVDGTRSIPWSRLVRQPALWVALLGFLLYLPPATSVLQLDPDAVEHIDLARRFAAGQGYVLGIKSFHLGGTDVLHSGLDERAPLYPLLVAGLLRLGLSLPALQVLNAALAAICAALVCGIGISLFGRRTGLLAGLLAA